MQQTAGDGILDGHDGGIGPTFVQGGVEALEGVALDDGERFFAPPFGKLRASFRMTGGLRMTKGDRFFAALRMTEGLRMTKGLE